MVHFTKLVAAVLVLLAIVLGVYAWTLGRRPPPPAIASVENPSAVKAAPLITTFPIVVATRAIPAGQAIASDALRVAQLPIQPAGTFGNAEDIVGRVPVNDISEGTPLLENQLASGLAQRLGEGERAVAIRADEVMGVGNRVQPGDFVDVFVLLKADGKDIDRNQARLLLSRKRVLAFGTASVENMQTQSRVEVARTAVLAIPVADINRLALGESIGNLLLALRHPGDTAQPDAAVFAGLSVTSLGTAGAVSGAATATAQTTAVRAMPAPRTGTPTAAPRGTEVEFIRGDRRETLTY